MGYCKKHDAYNGNGICPYCAGHTVDHTGDFAIPDEVVDLKLLLDARKRIAELEADVERLKALLSEARDDLDEWIGNEYPEDVLGYPVMLRRYHRDMDIVRRISAELERGE